MTQKDIRKSQDAAQQNISQGQKSRKEIIVESDNDFPLEDVEIFDDLTNQKFGDDRQVKRQRKKRRNVAR